MAMFSNRKVGSNYDFFSWFTYYVPGVGGMFGLLLWLLLGSLIGSLIAGMFMFFLGLSADSELVMIISYPLMFIPAMMYAKFQSGRNAIFEPGVSIDSNHFGKLGGFLTALCVMLATIGAGFMMDVVNSAMPPMPKWLEDALGGLTGGNVILNFICVSLFAPLFEEWLCRGEVLRGLLNCTRTTSDGTTVRGIKPVWAIVISAAFFAVIHMNPWQAIPAFALGLLFGYVYYKTGSIKLTMLMHFTNNTVALICGQLSFFEDAETWFDVLPVPVYCVLFVAFGAFIWWFVKQLDTIPMIDEQGNCDRVKAE